MGDHASSGRSRRDSPTETEGKGGSHEAHGSECGHEGCRVAAKTLEKWEESL